MAVLPRVAEQTRERISREFDDLGPHVCVAEMAALLRATNPELLDLVTKWAHDVGDTARIMVGFSFFYRLLDSEVRAAEGVAAGTGVRHFGGLPRVTAETRDAIVRQIDARGPEAFTRTTIADLERNNPELLQAAHHFASAHRDYLRTMQGFALVYACLNAQATADRGQVH
jgi:hypothetical protein